MEKQYDFSGWVTRNNLRCSDGRTIMKDAFKHHDGQTVPLVWNHNCDIPTNVLGQVLLHNRDQGVYGYASFNDTESGQAAKLLVQHGDIKSLSICANHLKQNGGNVMHGMIREVSLVLAGANPGAFIDTVMEHSDDSDEEAIIYTGEEIDFSHADSVDEITTDNEGLEHADKSGKEEKKVSEETEKKNPEETEKKTPEENKKEPESKQKSVEDIINTMNEEQQNLLYGLVGHALKANTTDDKKDDNANKDEKEKVEHSDLEGGNETMKKNVFDSEDMSKVNTLTHADQEAILRMAQGSNVGSFRAAVEKYSKENSLQHGIEEIETLFPEYKDVYPGAPELIERDQTWVGEVMKKTNKSPFSRIRTRQMDARGSDLRAKGYQKKGDKKQVSGDLKLMGRTTDPQTIYRKDALHRDDIVDITSFDVVSHIYGVMKKNILEDIALATMVGDLRDDGDPDKIKEEHIRPIWKDDELYTIHYDVDIEAAKEELNGTNTGANFSDNYIYAEAIIQAALYSREQYKGSGNLEFYCTPHLLNVMLLARDLNGRRIYDSKVDLAKALNVSAIHTAEQFEGLTRTTKEGKEKELLGLFVNLADYQHGSTKGGEITRFEQFDIDYNMEKYLIETRLSGALTKIKSAIALEMPVTEEAAG